MIKKYLFVSLFWLPLAAMEYNQYEMVVSVGPDRDPIPLGEVLRFKALTERLLHAGHRNNIKDGAWIYGKDDSVFPQQEKDALWIVYAMIQRARISNSYNQFSHYPIIGREKPINIPTDQLWKLAHYTYKWKECAPYTVGTKILEHLVAKEQIQYPALPTSHGWKVGSYSAVWTCNAPGHSYDRFFVRAFKDGVLAWHNHHNSLDNLSCSCELQSTNTIVQSFVQTYYVGVYKPNEPIFTKKHFQDFCINKAVNDISVDAPIGELTLTFVDDTKAIFDHKVTEGNTTWIYSPFKSIANPKVSLARRLSC